MRESMGRGHLVRGHASRPVGMGAARLVLLLIGLTGVGLASAASASAACLNEAFRVGPSALLPECRAYEMASLPDKAGGGMRSTLETKTTPSGDAVFYFSSAAFADAPSSVTLGTYISRRGADNWSTESVSPPQVNPSGALIKVAIPSPDLSKTLQYSKVALTPGAIEGGSNVYLQDNFTGERELVVAKEGNKLFQNLTGISTAGYLAGTADFSHVVFNTTVPLTDDAPAVASIYEYAEGELRLVNRRSDGSAETSGAHTSTSRVPYSHNLSEDGSRIFWMSGTSGVKPLYMREDGSETVAISASQRTGEVGVVKDADFAGAAPDGSAAYFLSIWPLTDASAPETSNRLYRYDVESGELTDVLAGGLNPKPNLRKVLAVSDDGSYVYFQAIGALTPDSTEGTLTNPNLYVWHEGEVKLVAQQAGATGMASPSGEHFGFTTSVALSPEDPPSLACSTATPPTPAPCLDAYHYDALAEELSCVTCTGGPALGPSELGNQRFHENGMGDEYSRPVLDDGTVFVDTPNRIVEADVNGTGDAYAWRDGRHWMLTTGTSPTPANFADATPDGSSVFVRTPEPLVPQDFDQSYDVYSVRIDGGLSGQFPPPPPPPCDGEACRPAAPPVAPISLPASEGERPDGNLPAACLVLSRRAGAAESRADRLERRARRAPSAKAARKLRSKARKQHKQANRLSAQARNCGGQG